MHRVIAVFTRLCDTHSPPFYVITRHNGCCSGLSVLAPLGVRGVQCAEAVRGGILVFSLSGSSVIPAKPSRLLERSLESMVVIDVTPSSTIGGSASRPQTLCPAESCGIRCVSLIAQSRRVRVLSPPPHSHCDRLTGRAASDGGVHLMEPPAHGLELACLELVGSASSPARVPLTYCPAAKWVRCRLREASLYLRSLPGRKASNRANRNLS